ncbi:M16 family metallopeptidase [Pseudomonas sp. GM48]|uniref:M16 family metallopeptidase n=1 Tax=Pseudomonas sp. GM48 TaxID=1144330 RepID=UPI00027007C9|nr:pitrilysin family protein [Pseudomonas sp. GM48]EJM55956.1 putative Zn-dependent peptidase [Pseudomonas sp. GM48]
MNMPTNELPSLPTHEFTLENGLRVIVREDHRTPRVGITLVFAVGTDDERPEDFGVTHVLQNALLPDYDDFIKKTGAVHQNFSDSERLTDCLLIAAEHLESALKIQSTIMTDELSDELLRTRLDEELLRNKKKSLFISTVSFSPEIDTLVNTGHSYYRPRDAIAANLERLTFEHLRNWRQSRYCPGNACLVIVGDVETEEARRLVERYFGSEDQRVAPFRSLIKGPSEPGYRQITQFLETEYPLMLVIFNTPGMENAPDPQSVRALEVLDSLFESSTRLKSFENDNRSAILATAFRLSRANNQFILAFYFQGDPQKAEADLWALLDDLKRVPFTPEDIEPAIIEESTTRQAFYDTPEGQSECIGHLVGTAQPWQLIDLEVAQLRSVTAQDIQHAANAYFTRERATVAHVFPIEKKTPA